MFDHWCVVGGEGGDELMRADTKLSRYLCIRVSGIRVCTRA